MNTPCAAFGVIPPRGGSQWPGKAGSKAALVLASPDL